MGKLARESVLVTTFIVIGMALGALTNVFFFPFVASKAELGEFKIFLYWSGIISLFASLGIQGTALRKYHTFKEEGTVGQMNFMLLVIPLVTMIIMALIILPFSHHFVKSINREGFTISTGQVLFVLACFTVLQTYIRVFSAPAILLKRNAGLFFNTDILARIMLVICFSLFAWLGLGMFQLLLLVLLSYLFQLIIVIYHGREITIGNGMKRPTWSQIGEGIKMGSYLMVDSAAMMLINRIDIMMIGYLLATSNTATQEFDIANSLSLFVFMPWRSLTNTTLPFIAESFRANDFKTIENIYKKTSLNLIILGLLIFTLVFSNIDSIIHVIPDDYTTIKYTVLFLGIAKIVDMAFSVNQTLIILSPFYRYNLLLSAIIIVLTVLVNIILTPWLGITGTAITTLIVILSYNLLKHRLLWSKYKLHPFHSNTLPVLFFMGIIFTISLFIPSLTGSDILNMAIRGAVTVVLTYYYLVWKKPSEDIEALRVKTMKRIPVLKKMVK